MERQKEGDEGVQGILDIHVHHAREIHNICIYNKQDVYAKLYLTSNAEEVLCTKTAQGGGRNPVFDEQLQVKVRCNPEVEDTSLRCEIYMLSRDKSYMEDQLLGSASLPLSSLVSKGTLMTVTKDFELCTSELFHSPAGILHLTLSYHAHPHRHGDGEESTVTTEGQSQRSNHPEAVDNDESSCSGEKEKEKEKERGEEKGKEKEKESGEVIDLEEPLVKVNLEPEKEKKEEEEEKEPVLQEKIVDMYMKSMQQFTESLAEMKLPLDLDNTAAQSSAKSSAKSDKTTTSKIYYGSRAFF